MTIDRVKYISKFKMWRKINRFYCIKIKKAAELPDNFWREIKYPTKIPKNSINNIYFKEFNSNKINSQTIQLLERLSLVDLEHKKAFKALQDSIEFANLITNIDTDNIEPLYTVLEDQELHLRDDVISSGNIKDDILKNAEITEEDYFIAPPGNIPLEQEEKAFDK